jgi:hypothetical protein
MSVFATTPAHQLIDEMISLQQLHHSLSAGCDAPLLLSRSDLVTDERTGGRTQALASPIRAKEHPAVARKHGTERVERLIAQHPGGATVIVENGRERSVAVRSVQDTLKGEITTRKGDDVSRGKQECRSEERKRQYKKRRSHLLDLSAPRFHQPEREADANEARATRNVRVFSAVAVVLSAPTTLRRRRCAIEAAAALLRPVSALQI